MFSYILSLAVGYLVGSIPTAYLLVHWKARVDIRKAGSGNVGALNTYEVTGSKMLGLVVMIVDALKGAAAVLLIYITIGNTFWILGVGGIAAVLGHNYSAWIKFRGGRGLATAAGVLIVMSWIVVVLWCSIWMVMKILSNNVHVGNIAATTISPLIMVIQPSFFLTPLLTFGQGQSNIILFCGVIFLLILVRHAEPIIELWHTSHKLFSKKS